MQRCETPLVMVRTRNTLRPAERASSSSAISPTWNSSDDPWNLRGYEQAAEVMAWALGERILTPSIPGNEPEKLGLAYRFLTGSDVRGDGAQL